MSDMDLVTVAGKSITAAMRQTPVEVVGRQARQILSAWLLSASRAPDPVVVRVLIEWVDALEAERDRLRMEA